MERRGVGGVLVGVEVGHGGSGLVLLSLLLLAVAVNLLVTVLGSRGRDGLLGVDAGLLRGVSAVAHATLVVHIEAVILAYGLELVAVNRGAVLLGKVNRGAIRQSRGRRDSCGLVTSWGEVSGVARLRGCAAMVLGSGRRPSCAGGGGSAILSGDDDWGSLRRHVGRRVAVVGLLTCRVKKGEGGDDERGGSDRVGLVVAL